jgi:hypothetical protein
MGRRKAATLECILTVMTEIGGEDREAVDGLETDDA